MKDTSTLIANLHYSMRGGKLGCQVFSYPSFFLPEGAGIAGQVPGSAAGPRSVSGRPGPRCHRGRTSRGRLSAENADGTTRATAASKPARCHLPEPL